LEAHGYVKGIMKKLASDPGTGIVGDSKDLYRRKEVFGENLRPQAPAASICESIWQTISNVLWFAIGFTSLLSSLVSLFFMEWKSVWEGISIIIVSIVLIAIIAVADYSKDK